MSDTMCEVLEVQTERARRLELENGQLRAALGYAIKEADRWYDDCRDGPVDTELMAAARKLLAPKPEALTVLQLRKMMVPEELRNSLMEGKEWEEFCEWHNSNYGWKPEDDKPVGAGEYHALVAWRAWFASASAAESYKKALVTTDEELRTTKKLHSMEQEMRLETEKELRKAQAQLSLARLNLRTEICEAIHNSLFNRGEHRYSTSYGEIEEVVMGMDFKS